MKGATSPRSRSAEVPEVVEPERAKISPIDVNGRTLRLAGPLRLLTISGARPSGRSPRGRFQREVVPPGLPSPSPRRVAMLNVRDGADGSSRPIPNRRAKRDRDGVATACERRRGPRESWVHAPCAPRPGSRPTISTPRSRPSPPRHSRSRSAARPTFRASPPACSGDAGGRTGERDDREA